MEVRWILFAAATVFWLLLTVAGTVASHKASVSDARQEKEKEIQVEKGDLSGESTQLHLVTVDRQIKIVQEAC